MPKRQPRSQSQQDPRKSNARSTAIPIHPPPVVQARSYLARNLATGVVLELDAAQGIWALHPGAVKEKTRPAPDHDALKARNLLGFPCLVFELHRNPEGYGFPPPQPVRFWLVFSVQVSLSGRAVSSCDLFELLSTAEVKAHLRGKPAPKPGVLVPRPQA